MRTCTPNHRRRVIIMKAGYKTTEFWLSLLAMVLGALVASNVLHVGSLAERIVGLAISTLASLGYTASRTALKGGVAASQAAGKAPLSDTAYDKGPPL